MEQPSAATSTAAASALAVVESCRCRLCFSVEDLSCSLFPPQGDPSREVIDMILECTSIRITFEEDFPSKVCEKCLETLGKFYQYRQRCLKNDKILKSQRRDNSKLVKVKIEPQVEDEHEHSSDLPQQEEPAQPVKQEDPGGSSILRSILLQCREPGRASSTGSGELEQDANRPEDVPENLLPVEDLEEELEVIPPQSSLLQQMLLQQAPNNNQPNSSPSLLKRMLLEGGGSDRQSPLEGSSNMNHRRSEDQKPSVLTNHDSDHQQQHQQQQHDENHNEEHSETPLASQLRAILLQHRAVAAATAAAACSGSSSATKTAAQNSSNNSTTAEESGKNSTGSAEGNLASMGTLEKPEVSYLRSLFMRNDSDGNEESDSDGGGDEPSQRELLFNMFQELRARNEINSEESDDSEDRAFDYRVPSVRRRSSESTAESRKRRRMTPTSDFTCLLCGRSFLTRSKLVLHMRTHIDPTATTTAGSSTSAATGTNVDAITANNVAAVHQSFLAAAAAAQSNSAAAAAAALMAGGSCSMSAAVAAAAAAHLTADNNNAAAGAGDTQEDDEESRQIELLERRSYACYICGADQNNLQQLKEHLLLAHQDRIRSRGRAKERPKPLISCNFCNRQFRSQFAYGEHLRTHTGERPFPCDQCDKRFPRRFQLLGHLYNVHKQSWVADESKAKFVKK